MTTEPIIERVFIFAARGIQSEEIEFYNKLQGHILYTISSKLIMTNNFKHSIRCNPRLLNDGKRGGGGIKYGVPLDQKICHSKIKYTVNVIL